MDLKTARQLYQGAVDFAKTWLDVLAKGDLRTANSMVYQTKEYTWTPKLLQVVIGSYGSSSDPKDDTGHKITPLSKTLGPPPAAAGREEEEVVIVDGYEYCFYHPSLPIAVGIRDADETGPKTLVGSLEIRSLPLDDEWSDLSAVFFMHQIDGKIAYELQRIEVM